MIDYKTLKVDELRTMIAERKLLTEGEAALIKGKSNLIDILEGTAEKKVGEFGEEELDIEFPDEEDDSPQVLSECKSKIPGYGKDGWQDFLLAALRPEEKIGEYPRCDGLRRLAETYLGEIIRSGVKQVFPPTTVDGPGRATVVWEIEIAWKASVPEYLDINNFAYPTRTYSDVADVWIGNVEDVFAIHPTATAATRAEGRALRKALGLTVITAEEAQTDKDARQVVSRARKELEGDVVSTSELEDYDNSMLSGTQSNFIEKKCEQMGIDVYKFINLSHYLKGMDIAYNSLYEVPRSVAAKMIEQLNKYQSGSRDAGESKDIPNEIKKVN